MEKLPNGVCFFTAGYSETRDYAIARTDMQGGLAKQRPKRSVPLITRQGTLYLKDRESRTKEEFEEFLDKIGGGTQYFIYHDPIRNKDVRARFVNTTWDFQINGRLWSVACQLETVG